jgi:hypothetical protein|tara:strand:- start:235 stop:621 length:387 start_codon:yes stop_codon:yes gene_type:complete
VKYLILIFLFCNCTPTKQLSRLIKNNPDLIQNVDTTIYIESSSVDTSFIFSENFNRDTFYIEDIKTKIFRYYDTLRVETESTRDSVIIKTNTIKIVPEKIKQNHFNKVIIVLSFLVVLMVLYIVGKLV